jgi:RNA exonuclease 1
MYARYKSSTGQSKDFVYSCCGQGRGSAGCSENAFHVFKESGFDKLHARIPFWSLPASVENAHSAIACDCEMAYTDGGMELIRVTLVDLSGSVVIDELVKTNFPVLDLNSQCK